MFFTSSAKHVLSSVFIWVASVSAYSAPVVVNFDSTGFFGFVGPAQTDTSYVESGFRFTPAGGDALVDLSFCTPGLESCITNNASQYLTALNDSVVTITADQAFSLTGLDASFFPLPTPPGIFTGLNFGLKLTGELWSGGPVEQLLTLVEGIVLGDFIFSAYLGDSALSNLRSLTLSACLIDGANCVRSGSAFDDAGLLVNDMQFAIDNLAFDTATSVPEPGVFWLVLAGLGAFTLVRRLRVL